MMLRPITRLKLHSSSQWLVIFRDDVAKALRMKSWHLHRLALLTSLCSIVACSRFLLSCLRLVSIEPKTMTVTATNFALHPLFYLAFQKSILILLLGFTSCDSILRPASLPLLIFCNYYLIFSYTQYIPRSPWIDIIAGEVQCGLLDHIEKLLLSRWSFEVRGPSAEIEKRRELGEGKKIEAFIQDSSTGNETWDRLGFGTWAAISSRYVGSPYQARHVSPYSTSDPSYIPSRRVFLLQGGATFLFSYFLTDLLVRVSQSYRNHTLFAESHVPFYARLDEVTAEEVLIRVGTTIGFWFGAYTSIQAYHSATALIAVASGVMAPADWRPIFGSLSNAYTLRGFWGKFWPQLLRKRLTKIARYITFNLLHLPRPSYHPLLYPVKLFTRYLEVFLVFGLLGSLHLYIEVARGLRWEESGTLEFSLLMATGIVVEDFIRWMIGLGKDDGAKEDRDEGEGSGIGPSEKFALAKRVIGYMWVLLFFSWATPAWRYPVLRRNTGATREDPVPFSFFGQTRGL